VLRSYLLIFLVLLIGAVGLMPLIMSIKEGVQNPYIIWTTAGMLIGFPILLTPTVLCDFRGDVDRMEVLKSLPIRPAWLAVGQLMAPSLVVVAVQALVAAVAMLILGRFEAILAAVPLLAVPVNFVVFGVENLLFLLFPMRMVAVSPGDFQTAGRNMLNYVAKFLCLGPITLLAVLVGLPIGLVTQNVAAGLAGAWIAVLGCGIGVVPLVVLAFKRFDVARDTPT
jgi:hypothetical protein